MRAVIVVIHIISRSAASREAPNQTSEQVAIKELMHIIKILAGAPSIESEITKGVFADFLFPRRYCPRVMVRVIRPDRVPVFRVVAFFLGAEYEMSLEYSFELELKPVVHDLSSL